jgi:hypothetical protein
MNLMTVAIGLAVLAIVCLAAYKIISDRRKGIGSCGCNCSDCASSCCKTITDDLEGDEK